MGICLNRHGSWCEAGVYVLALEQWTRNTASVAPSIFGRRASSFPRFEPSSSARSPCRLPYSCRMPCLIYPPVLYSQETGWRELMRPVEECIVQRRHSSCFTSPRITKDGDGSGLGRSRSPGASAKASSCAWKLCERQTRSHAIASNPSKNHVYRSSKITSAITISEQPQILKIII